MEQDALTNTTEEQEYRHAEELYESFFGNGTEEEQLRIRELAAKMNIRDNDALWIIIYVLNYFGRFYRDLPEKLRATSSECFETVQKAAAEISESEARKAQVLFAETLMKSTQEILEQHKKRAWLYEMFLPLAWSCLGVFCLCLVLCVSTAQSPGGMDYPARAYLDGRFRFISRTHRTGAQKIFQLERRFVVRDSGI